MTAHAATLVTGRGWPKLTVGDLTVAPAVSKWHRNVGGVTAVAPDVLTVRDDGTIVHVWVALASGRSAVNIATYPPTVAEQAWPPDRRQSTYETTSLVDTTLLTSPDSLERVATAALHINNVLLDAAMKFADRTAVNVLTLLSAVHGAATSPVDQPASARAPIHIPALASEARDRARSRHEGTVLPPDVVLNTGDTTIVVALEPNWTLTSLLIGVLPHTTNAAPVTFEIFVGTDEARDTPDLASRVASLYATGGVGALNMLYAATMSTNTLEDVFTAIDAATAHQ